jgi:hypothetical protein
MVCTKKVFAVGAAALVMGGSLMIAAPATAGESTGRWRNGMVAGPYGPAYYGQRYAYRPQYGYRRHNNGGAVAAGVIGGLALGALASSAYAAPAYPSYYGAGAYAAPSCYMVRRRFVDEWGRLIIRREQICE